MELFHLAKIRAEGSSYVEFLRRPDLSAGVYRLPAGAVDAQQPHAEDELYFVTAGKARFQAGTEDVAVGPGDILFVPAREPHHFYDIGDAFEVLVLFGPAEGTRGQPAGLSA